MSEDVIDLKEYRFGKKLCERVNCLNKCGGILEDAIEKMHEFADRKQIQLALLCALEVFESQQ